MIPGVRRGGRYLLQLGLTVGVTWFILARLGITLDEVRGLEREEWRPDLLPLLLSSLVLLGGYLMSALLWGRMVRELGGPRIPPGRGAAVYLTANLGRYLPGKVWQLAGLAMLARREGVSPGVATVAAVLGQVVALGGAALVGAVAFAASEERLRWVGGGMLAAVVVLLLLASVPPLYRAAVGRAFRLARKEAPASLLSDRIFGIRWMALYTLNWGLYAASFWGLAVSLRLELTPWEAGPAFAAAYVLGYLAIFAPAGLGVREGFLVALLQPAVGTGAVALAVVSRLWTTVVEIVPAGVVAVAEWVRRGRGGTAS